MDGSIIYFSGKDLCDGKVYTTTRAFEQGRDLPRVIPAIWQCNVISVYTVYPWEPPHWDDSFEKLDVLRTSCWDIGLRFIRVRSHTKISYCVHSYRSINSKVKLRIINIESTHWLRKYPEHFNNMMIVIRRKKKSRQLEKKYRLKDKQNAHSRIINTKFM